MKKKEDYSQFGVTPNLFTQWRSPRFGTENPTVMNNPVWEWLIRTKHCAYSATEMIKGPSSMSVGPCWCFDRFGQSLTTLTDGRKVYIGGEHEDHYDPDFNIYNDVVVEELDGTLKIFGYSREQFPPTDFHSATLIDNTIVIIGNLGYQKDRKPGLTQVLLLDTETFSISSFETSGQVPGWIYEHHAQLSTDKRSIIVTGGQIDKGPDNYPAENINDWQLDLKSGVWQQLTDHSWPRWVLSRVDEDFNQLFKIRSALFSLEMGWKSEFEKDMSGLEQALNIRPDVKAVSELYKPPIPHKSLPEREDDYGVHRIAINDITVRYVEEDGYVQLTVEGDLPDTVVDKLLEDLQLKLSKLEGIEYVKTEIT